MLISYETNISLLSISNRCNVHFTSNVNAETEYENPDLQLKFNWKEEGDMLSPQTKIALRDPEAQKTVHGSIY